MDDSISQERMKVYFIHRLTSKGVLYEKCRGVLAKVAQGGEEIVSVTSVGKETENKAQPGDYLVQNQTTAGEWYIVPKDKFEKRYLWLADREDGLAKYKPKGKVIALPLSRDLLTELDLPETFHFIAPWGEPQLVHMDDFIVTLPDLNEVYRIGRKEFAETYRRKPLYSLEEEE